IGIIGHWLVLVPLLLIPVTIFVSFMIRKPLTRILGANMQESAQRTAHLFEVMNGVDTIKTLGAEAWARRQWEMLTVKISENSVQMREWTSFGTYMSLLVTNLDSILIVMFGALMISSGDLTMGQLIACSMLATRAITPATQIAALVVRYEQTRQAIDALDKIMEAPTDETTDSLHLPRMSGRIDFRDAHFAYPNSAPLLKGLNLTIRPGEKVGFIGRIGSGKSTLFKLLLNLYSPDQGAVMVDGMAVNQLEPQSLRRQVGYVPQDVVLFHGDIRENILLGSAQVSDADMLEALRLSCLDETLAQMPNGLGTQVGERGERLSGGQRQAVSIARALVQQPRMLLLDEPSSMMDPATEARLIENLRNIKGTTMLLVTHRTAMLPLVDRLVVLDQGKVVLDGPRNEVLRKLQGGPAPVAPREVAA
ncbi:MAG: ATP-binding cassette domain-containing protein, partial [Zoogloea sp.]|nr:ATP-binding cassette domain-containing protein [Zoogloea sp.]